MELLDQKTTTDLAWLRYWRIQVSQSVPVGTDWSQKTSKPCSTKASRNRLTRSRSLLEYEKKISVIVGTPSRPCAVYSLIHLPPNYNSIATFWSSTKPASLRPWRNAATNTLLGGAATWPLAAR